MIAFVCSPTAVSTVSAGGERGRDERQDGGRNKSLAKQDQLKRKRLDFGFVCGVVLPALSISQLSRADNGKERKRAPRVTVQSRDDKYASDSVRLGHLAAKQTTQTDR